MNFTLTQKIENVQNMIIAHTKYGRNNSDFVAALNRLLEILQNKLKNGRIYN